MNEKFIGFDFDNTVVDEEGQPNEKIVNLVNDYLSKGKKVKIFTARPKSEWKEIKDFCESYFGSQLDITNLKEPEMELFYDDKAISVRDGEPMLKGLGGIEGALKEKVMRPEKESNFMNAVKKFSQKKKKKHYYDKEDMMHAK